MKKMKRKYGVTDRLRKISVDEITWGEILQIIFIARHGKILFYNSKRIKEVNYIMAPNPAVLKLSTILWKMIHVSLHIARLNDR